MEQQLRIDDFPDNDPSFALVESDLLPANDTSSTSQPRSATHSAGSSQTRTSLGGNTVRPVEASQEQQLDESTLRRKIFEIHRDELMSSKYSKTETEPQEVKEDETEPSEKDLEPTWHDAEAGIRGCKHYQRNAKLMADCCKRWFTCRFCHDDNSDHNIIRQNTKYMMCMYCKAVQPAAQICSNTECSRTLARYYCPKCKLWDDSPKKPIYHCDDCGICRVGRGLGQDYYHCKKCNVCMAIGLKNEHRCIERNLESDCPICGEFMFTSTSRVIFMPCGHCIHEHCFNEYAQTSYQCPTCLKSLTDTRHLFARIDAMLSQSKMPPEYDDYVSNILCNDCTAKSKAKYHFLYHKCQECGSYNTTVLSTVQGSSGQVLNNASATTSGTQASNETENSSGDTTNRPRSRTSSGAATASAGRSLSGAWEAMWDGNSTPGGRDPDME
ncbi:hypothetical protein BZG36_05199 [Bifiguratus adelaidae]|uniref:RING finger and CHY zinc finger domain-containing protein 1 n=1 Tax=Bifiguratus adelaidae TaxID=1938954 RepID=A0A261XUJ4_9FUNG|nr:hypothetical protein BZG36_05199 [Bifiguratus adelaidae]